MRKRKRIGRQPSDDELIRSITGEAMRLIASGQALAIKPLVEQLKYVEWRMRKGLEERARHQEEARLRQQRETRNDELKEQLVKRLNAISRQDAEKREQAAAGNSLFPAAGTR